VHEPRTAEINRTLGIEDLLEQLDPELRVEVEEALLPSLTHLAHNIALLCDFREGVGAPVRPRRAAVHDRLGRPTEGGVSAPATAPRRRGRAAPPAPAASDASVELIPVANIVTGLNNRTVFKQDKLQDLADSMRAHGLAQPITVRPWGSGFQLVAGERRWRAAQILGWETIPALVRDLDDRAARSITLIENSHREDVDPIDEALGYKAYMDEFGAGVAEVVAAVNLPSVRIYKRLELLKLRDDVREQVRKNPSMLTLFELMTILDRNRQGLALRVLTSRAPITSLSPQRLAVFGIVSRISTG
jgi:ParB/RepB/Spo0J family partition protein